MSSYWKKIILCFIILFSFHNESVLAQYYLYNTFDPAQIEMKFVKHSIDALPRKIFFNPLKIVNRSRKSETFTVKLTPPQGWSVVGSEQLEVNLAPFDSIYIPVRVSVGEKVRGDIGYSVIASITDSKGNTLKNEYCFLKIPRQRDYKIRYLNRKGYIDQRTGQSDFSISISNKGNREELFNLMFEADPLLGVGPLRAQQFVSEVTVPPYTDTTLFYNVELKDLDFKEKYFFKINTNVSTIDTSINNTLWFYKIDSRYNNIIPSANKPLVVEFNVHGILQGNKKPTTSTNIIGDILLKKNREIYYSIRSYSGKSFEQINNSSRVLLGFKTHKFLIEVGDVNHNYEGNIIGRGLFTEINLKHATYGLLVNQNKISNDNYFGNRLTIKVKPNFALISEYSYRKNSYYPYESQIFSIGSKASLFKKHNFNTLFSYNNLSQNINDKNQFNEYGTQVGYTSVFKYFQNYLRIKYGSKLYNGRDKGKLEIDANSNFKKGNNQVNLGYREFNSNITKIESSTLTQDNVITRKLYFMEYGRHITPNLYIFSKPTFEQSRWNSLNYLYPGYIKVNSYQVYLGSRIRLNTSTTFNLQILFSKSNFDKTPIPDTILLRDRLKFNYQYLTLNLRSKKWGLITAYTLGPKSQFEQQNYLFSGRQNRNIRVMPYYESFIYKNIIYLSGNISYSQDIISNSSYLNVTGLVYFYLKNDWRLNFLTVYSLQKRADSKDVVQSYKTVYFEAGVRKEFNFQQPRVKYHNISLIFFKDYNGNSIQESNEPGIKNVLVNFSKAEVDNKVEIPSEINSLELLSNNLGIVSVENIPNGLYTLSYNPIGKEAGTYTKALDDLNININKSGPIYIPFVEKNKVFGKIILNRSKLSGIGKIDVSNIRITSTDSKGKTYSTLTNKNGEFIIFAPVTDEYSVSINNIFYENFDLRQNNFKVHFNGYKQFEVNFVFDEKIRRINFSPSTQDAQLANILQVRRTNLRGTVKDESSLTPIRARVNLINTKLNTVLTSMYSSSQTGDYNISFMADDSYLLEVLADGYWYHSENLNLNQVTTFLNVTKDILLKPISIGSKIELNIRFGINKTDLAPESVAELNRLIKLLKDNGNIKIEVQGHSDDLEALSNPQISEERAKKVARYLIENGFSNLQIRGFGNTVPISSNDTEQGRETNRRVEIEVVSK